MIEVKFDKSINSDYEIMIINNVNLLISHLVEKSYISKSIVSIIIAWDINEYITNFNTQRNTNHKRTNSKIGTGEATNLCYEEDNEKKIEIIISTHLYSCPDYFFSYLISLILGEYSLIYLDVSKFRYSNTDLKIDESKNFDNVIEYLFTKWFSPFYAQNIVNKMIVLDTDNLLSVFDSYIQEFKRNIKSSLFLCNSDDESYKNNWLQVYGTLIDETYYLIKSCFCSGIQFENIEKINCSDKTNDLYFIREILLEIKLNHDLLISNNDINLNRIRQLVLVYFELNSLKIRQKSNDISFHCLTNPKLLFRDHLIETEDRIVAFIDILGFKEMINDYEQNKSCSTLLQDLENTLRVVISNTIDKWKNKSITGFEIIGFEYKIFSDNICLSVPFFNSKSDFEFNLGVMLNIIKNFQFDLLAKNYLIRGGISIGSYYSNDNLIFSDGLIDAYILESKYAKYPRVLLDKKIISRIEKSFKNNLLAGTILFSSIDNLYFVNPFLSKDETLSKFDKLKSFIFDDENFDDDFTELLKLNSVIIEDMETQLNSELSNDSTISVINDNLEIEFQKLKQKELLVKQSYRDKIRNRKINSYPSDKVDWMINLLRWYFYGEISEFNFKKIN
jgi:hypothetical protein